METHNDLPNVTEVENGSLLLNGTESGENGVFLSRDNPSGLAIISFQTSRAIISVVNFYVFPCVFLLGISTNFINCVVIRRQGLKNRMNLCLFWLAVADLGYLLCRAVNCSQVFVGLVDPVFAQEYTVKTNLYMTGFSFAFLSTSGCISVLIAVERCLCVVFPLKAPTLMSTTTMAIILFTTTALLQLGYVIFPLRFQALAVFDKGTGQTVWILIPTQGRDKEILEILFTVIFDVLLLFVLPITSMSIVVICTVITVLRLKLALAWRLRTTSRSSNVSADQLQQAALTKMLVLISCIYIVCSAPGCILALWRRIDPQFSTVGAYSNLFYALHPISYHVFSATNSSVNFFVYYWRSSRYRAVLQGLCCCRSKAKKKQPQLALASVCLATSRIKNSAVIIDSDIENDTVITDSGIENDTVMTA